MQRVNWLQLRTIVSCIKLCFGDLSNGVVGETVNEPYKNKGRVGG